MTTRRPRRWVTERRRSRSLRTRRPSPFATLLGPEKGGGPNQLKFLRDPGGDRPLGRKAGSAQRIHTGPPPSGTPDWSHRLALAQRSSSGYQSSQVGGERRPSGASRRSRRSRAIRSTGAPSSRGGRRPGSSRARRRTSARGRCPRAPTAARRRSRSRRGGRARPVQRAAVAHPPGARLDVERVQLAARERSSTSVARAGRMTRSAATPPRAATAATRAGSSGSRRG
jgi:hypothetical protein